MHARRLSPVFCLFCAVQVARAQEPEPTHYVVVLDNGDFDAPPAAEGSPFAGRIPWWSGTVGAEAIKPQGDLRWLKLERTDQWLAQPFPVYAPLQDGVLVRGIVRGHLPKIAIVDARGEAAVLELERQIDPKAFVLEPEPIAFEVRLAEFAEVLGRPLEPRLSLRLGPPERVAYPGGHEEADKVYWTALQVLAPMPLPSPEALRAEIVAQLDRIFTTYLERGLDRSGPRATGFVAQSFDVESGAPLEAVPGGWLYLWEYLLFALEVEPDPEWRAGLDAFVRDYLELGFHPGTGLPRKWDCAADRPLDGEVVEVHSDLRFLLDLVEHGPEAWRGPALEAARRMGEALLAQGILPDGTIASRYVPESGQYDLNVPAIRALNLPAQLGRLGALGRDARFTAAARRALSELEFTHRWGGAPERIDPDVDDLFGTYGAASVVLLEHRPDEAFFGALAQTGWEHFAPLWRDALRFGGSVAADQVRCWALLADYARLRPEILPELGPLLGEAARAHLKGEQYDGGAWGDVTHQEHGPRPGLGVGDQPGAPANLLWGLAVLHDPKLEPAEKSVRALFTAVMRSTFDTYGRPYGVLETRAAHAGPDRCGAELRLCKGLVAMLRTL
jgi:hypothetical protein